MTVFRSNRKGKKITGDHRVETARSEKTRKQVDSLELTIRELVQQLHTP